MASPSDLAPAPASVVSSRWLHVALWVVQGLLALNFGMAGVMKTFMPVAELVKNNINWAGDIPLALLRFIGVAELLGALGLILPAALRIKPVLTPLAATGLLVVMVLAAGFHATRGEWQGIAFNTLLGALAAFVAWGRFRKAPIAAYARREHEHRGPTMPHAVGQPQ